MVVKVPEVDPESWDEEDWCNRGMEHMALMNLVGHHKGT
jgi:hypothetical protein